MRNEDMDKSTEEQELDLVMRKALLEILKEDGAAFLAEYDGEEGEDIPENVRVRMGKAARAETRRARLHRVGAYWVRNWRNWVITCLILMFTFSAVYSASADFRNIIKRAVETVTGESSTITFLPGGSGSAKRLAWNGIILEGYENTENLVSDEYDKAVYSNGQDYYTFERFASAEKMEEALTVTNIVKTEDTTIGEAPGKISTTLEGSYSIIWYKDQNWYSLVTTLDSETALALAGSVPVM